MTDAQKQEWADSLLVQALLVDSSVDLAKKQPALMAQVKANIASGARKTLGFDLNRMRLTNEGLLL
ncbi:MAG: hypothetical protein EOP06_31040 [Proteobacteria bacterium]|nr:MAG: hypothetical protein EOP06_31040 [Pseudomonadota bacterium]